MTRREAYADLYGLDSDTLIPGADETKQKWTDSDKIAVLVVVREDQRTGHWADNINVLCPICDCSTLNYAQRNLIVLKVYCCTCKQGVTVGN